MTIDKVAQIFDDYRINIIIIMLYTSRRTGRTAVRDGRGLNDAIKLIA